MPKTDYMAVASRFAVAVDVGDGAAPAFATDAIAVRRNGGKVPSGVIVRTVIIVDALAFAIVGSKSRLSLAEIIVPILLMMASLAPLGVYRLSAPAPLQSDRSSKPRIPTFIAQLAGLVMPICLPWLVYFYWTVGPSDALRFAFFAVAGVAAIFYIALFVVVIKVTRGYSLIRN
jgi:hypothetical protein